MQFYLNQNKQQQDLYLKLLQITGSLSNLFSTSDIPFIYYRAMENIFCKAFDAYNLSRSDISADAGKDGIGIGLKTFLQNNGLTFQKIAEFNKESSNFDNLSDEDLIHKVSEFRNRRIISTLKMCDFNSMMYHLLTRSSGKLFLYEEPMDLIKVDDVRLLKTNNTTLHFTDGLHYYNFNKSKSTLFKRFDTLQNKRIVELPVEILDDPFAFLLSINGKSLNQIKSDTVSDDVLDYIVLPLYSPSSGKVELKSGLNQWNARGRIRHPNEVYVPIPSWIHVDKYDFFKDLYNTPDHKTGSFNVKLPNNKIISMKVAQSNGKALMSNPNKVLGKWILRDILNLPPNRIVTKFDLDMIGIDSIKLSKLKNGSFVLDFLQSGSFEVFEQEFRIF